MKIIRDIADQEGIDLDAETSDVPALPEPSNHPLTAIAEEFRSAARRSMEELGKKIAQFGEDLAAWGGATPDAVADLRKITTDYQTVVRYHALIPAKINRALMSKREAEAAARDGELGSELDAEDAAGNAKVAHYGLTKSIGALQGLYAWDTDDDLLSLLALAERLRRMLDAEIPGLRTFKHPWFDAHLIR